MGEYTQENRFIQVYTPLDPDVLLLESFQGHEGVSRLFNFELRMHSQMMCIPFNKIVGKTATIKMLLPNNRVRYINGIVSSFTQGGKWVLNDGDSSTRMANYNATLVPWLWVLTRTADCRIFQDKTVPDILMEVFNEHGFSHFKFLLDDNNPVLKVKREYCVQYRETDFNFVSRLLEEEGLFYFFEHYEEKHVLVVADHNNHFKPSPLPLSIDEYGRETAMISYDSTETQQGYGDIQKWSSSQEVRPGMYIVNDFNFTDPSCNLTETAPGKDERKLEIYDFPGEYTVKEQGARLASLRMEEENASMVIIKGTSNCRGLSAGYKFELRNHYRTDFNMSYVVISAYHWAEQMMTYRTSHGGTPGFTYSNEFQCIRSDTPYRPPRVTPVPIVHGSQTAIVVSHRDKNGNDKDKEISVDEYGRVKVRFHWDRDDKRSCWVRVSQNWAGKRWGAVFLPRVGQEVIVDFLEGDPDRPIITGRVYNGASMPPYKLPAEKTKSTIKSQSSEGGGGFNEIRFEDKKGGEQLFFHAERNHDVRVKHDKIEWVGNESHLIVKKDQLESVEGDKHLQVKGDRNEKVDGTVSLKVGGDIFRKTDARYALDAANEIYLKSGNNLVIESDCTLTLKVGGNFIQIDHQCIYIEGAKVHINSGKEAKPRFISTPEAPRLPREADHAVPGANSKPPPVKEPVKPEKYSVGALALKKAAQNGTPFCEKCQ
jgi:type VI secretion system secreted protein VgrG